MKRAREEGGRGAEGGAGGLTAHPLGKREGRGGEGGTDPKAKHRSSCVHKAATHLIKGDSHVEEAEIVGCPAHVVCSLLRIPP